MYANQILAQHGIPIPKTMLTRFPSNPDLVEKQVGFPCVVKVVTGSHGAGVYLCENKKQFSDLSELISALDFKNSMIVQEYVQHSEGRDLRVIVIGGRVIGAMLRQATDGSFKANISRGGKGVAYDIDEKMELLSMKRQKFWILTSLVLICCFMKTDTEYVKQTPHQDFMVLRTLWV